MQDIDETNLSEFGQRCEDCFVQDRRVSLGNDCTEGMVAETNSEHTADLSIVLNEHHI